LAAVLRLNEFRISIKESIFDSEIIQVITIIIRHLEHSSPKDF